MAPLESGAEHKGSQMENEAKQQEVPTRTEAPDIWLIRKEVPPRRLRYCGDDLRTTIGYDTLFLRRIDSIRIAEINKVQPLAPYSPPGGKLGAYLIGAALGVLIGGTVGAAGMIPTAIVIMTMAIATYLIGSGQNAPKTIAKLVDKKGRTYIIAYKVEDVDQVKILFKNAEWDHGDEEDDISPLRIDELKQLDRMRIGLVLAASAMGILIMTYVSYQPVDDHYAIKIPTQIFVLAAWGIVLGIMAFAWFRMIQASRKK